MPADRARAERPTTARRPAREPSIRPPTLPGIGERNREIKRPRSPGPWIDEEKNHVTGQTYRDFRSGCTFADGVEIVRQANGGFQGGGGFRSKGPVRWALKTCKMARWFEDGMKDEGLWNHAAGRPYTPAELRKLYGPKNKRTVSRRRSTQVRDDWDDPF